MSVTEEKAATLDKERAEAEEPQHPAAAALGLKALTTEEDRLALGKPEKFIIRGAGGADPEHNWKGDVFPRPFHVLDKIGDIWLEIFATADNYGRGKDKSLKAFIAETVAAKREQRDNLFRLVQLILLRPTGGPIDWKLLDDDDLPGDLPKRDWLEHNMTAPDVLKLLELFAKQNDWQGLLKKVAAVEAVGMRFRMAQMASLRASAARSLTSSGKRAGRTTTSAGA